MVIPGGLALSVPNACIVTDSKLCTMSDGYTAPITAILLAAGESTRMGQHKALLPWEGRPLLAYQVAQLLASPISCIVVVLGHREAKLRCLLPSDPRIVTISNPEYQTGKVSSILAGLPHVPDDAHILILGVDQPRPASLIQAVCQAHLGASSPNKGASRTDTSHGRTDGPPVHASTERPAWITIAGYGVRRGHPVIFHPDFRADLAGINEATEGLRAVLRRHAPAVHTCDTGLAVALVNLNTPDDYVAALRVTGQQPPPDA